MGLQVVVVRRVRDERRDADRGGGSGDEQDGLRRAMAPAASAGERPHHRQNEDGHEDRRVAQPVGERVLRPLDRAAREGDDDEP
ncbi:MAG TPA: hypothetical protein VNC85_04070, partial [Mycobacteriales bacterium]|nr:hypothetical protein [Mycobacteriales bacterium]